MRWLVAVAPLLLSCSAPSAPDRPPVPAEDYDRVVEEAGELRERIVELEAALENVAPVAPVEAAARCPEPPEEEALRTAEEEARAARGRAALAEQRLARHQVGLERCVAALNDLERRRTIVVGEGSPSRPSGASPERPRQSQAPRPDFSGVKDALQGLLDATKLRPVRTYSPPRVQLAGEEVLVTARLWNPEDVEQNVRVQIELLVDGVVKNEEFQRLAVPAAGQMSVAARFHNYGYQGTYSGRVRVLE